MHPHEIAEARYKEFKELVLSGSPLHTLAEHALKIVYELDPYPDTRTDRVCDKVIRDLELVRLAQRDTTTVKSAPVGSKK